MRPPFLGARMAKVGVSLGPSHRAILERRPLLTAGIRGALFKQGRYTTRSFHFSVKYGDLDQRELRTKLNNNTQKKSASGTTVTNSKYELTS